MKTVAIIQARMSSTRLPGKVLLPLGNEPVLAWSVNRLARVKQIHEIIIATTTESSDDPITELCQKRNWPCYRGSLEDVLDRYFQAARQYQADVILRITSDCPFIDPEVVSTCLMTFLEQQPRVDYLSNGYPTRTFPRGLDTEVFSFQVLKAAWENDINPAWREHVTPFMYRNPDLFRCAGIVADVRSAHLRWTLDTSEDFELLCRIAGHFGSDRFTWKEVLNLMMSNPDLLEINRHIEQKKVE